MFPERLSRRALVGTALASAGAATAGAVLTRMPESPAPAVEPFHGKHQAGIATRAQSHALFLACDIARPDRGALRDLLATWTATAAALTAGDPAPEKPDTPVGLSAHTDFATGLNPAHLTVTFGLGPALFDDRFGLADRRPAHLWTLPEFAGDALNPAWCGGDILVQICADDAQIVSHTFRALRAGMPGLARMRWTQQGFLSRPADGGTPRNMFGHKDGTANPASGTREFADTVWVDSPAEPAWFRNGTYLVFRKIRMRTAEWDQLPTVVHDQIIGRRRSDGAPLGAHGEFDPIDLEARTARGDLAIPADAHVRLVHGIPMLRRGYNYDYGLLTTADQDTEAVAPHSHAPGTDADHTHGGHDRLDVGLLFAAYQNNPPGQFIRAQRLMAATDPLTPLIQHTGSALFAIPPGAAPGAPIAAALDL
ncbi:Dyp-type peroxidase [Nocardia goodfellowii]|uniref:Dye decolorizing peroxidase/deferrochelatase/peroxidase EfeB n=1 Tax=Nocardia goodfellowii TaxID=882446 RepID=A0ABS4QNH4_9NOCA|nr:Dyp-type peroxidase [Nocardia goodfellowii]MBP2193266.1 dye decolorizing peroxidase/deferrochelatase/peroxidase EfeB [Nocardia goodfellowii]